MKSSLDAYIEQLSTENERQIRGFTIAKHYLKLGHCEKAKSYLLLFHRLKKNAESWKLLAQCEAALHNTSTAIAAYQESLLLKEKQPEVIIEICKLLLSSDKFDMPRAKYWAEVAVSEGLNAEAVWELQRRLIESSPQLTSSCITSALPIHATQSLSLQQQLDYVKRSLLLHGPLSTLFYIFEIELGSENPLKVEPAWIELCLEVLNAYEASTDLPKNWSYWLLKLSYLDRSLCCLTCNEGDSTKFLEQISVYDQHLFELTALPLARLCQPPGLAQLFREHFTAKLIMHAASFIIARESRQSQPQWKYVLTLVLPLLLFAYQVPKYAQNPSWSIHCNEQLKMLAQKWRLSGAYRCLQIGTLFMDCIGVHETALWLTKAELLQQIEQTTSNPKWRENIYKFLFVKVCYKLKIGKSMLALGESINKPRCELPTSNELKAYACLAQRYTPHSLRHMLYIALSYDDVSTLRITQFDGLPASLCSGSVASLDQLDVESFLYALCLQCKHDLGQMQDPVQRLSIHLSALFKPRLTAAQRNWWSTAYLLSQKQFHKVSKEDLLNLELGIETVRGINGPKADMLLVLDLAGLLKQRAECTSKPADREALEARIKQLYKCALNMYEMSSNNALEPFGKYFFYTVADAVELEFSIVEAIAYMASICFINSPKYAQLQEEMSAIKHPFAACLAAVAKYKLDSRRTSSYPVQNNSYLSNVYKCLMFALRYLHDTLAGRNHPLFVYLQSERTALKKRFSKSCFNITSLTDSFTSLRQFSEA